MRNILIVSGIIVVICVWVLVYNVNLLSNRETEIQSHVGETIIVGNDTALIIDYSYWESTYKLSNGKEISFAFYIKHNNK